MGLQGRGNTWDGGRQMQLKGGELDAKALTQEGRPAQDCIAAGSPQLLLGLM